MWQLDYKESWAPKYLCYWSVVLEKTLESPLDFKEIQTVHPKGDQSWIFIGRVDTEAEAAILWPPDVKNWLLGKDLGAGKDWRREEKGMTEDELVGCHHWLNARKFEQAPGVDDGQGSLACCSPWGHKGSDVIEWLNWTEHIWMVMSVSTSVYILSVGYPKYYSINNNLIMLKLIYLSIFLLPNKRILECFSLL